MSSAEAAAATQATRRDPETIPSARAREPAAAGDGMGRAVLSRSCNTPASSTPLVVVRRISPGVAGVSLGGFLLQVSWGRAPRP